MVLRSGRSALILAIKLLLLSGCSSQGKVTLSADSKEVGADALVSADGKGSKSRLGNARIKTESCKEYDLTPEHSTLTIAAFKKHLDAQGLKYSVQTERDDLHLFDLEFKGSKTRLRVATLESAQAAGRHLHQALLEHGRGYWGVHRANLAVLAPAASTTNAVGFAQETGLACWGVFTQAARDDSFVVSGAYFEL